VEITFLLQFSALRPSSIFSPSPPPTPLEGLRRAMLQDSTALSNIFYSVFSGSVFSCRQPLRKIHNAWYCNQSGLPLLSNIFYSDFSGSVFSCRQPLRKIHNA
jgi:hypothetical protein